MRVYYGLPLQVSVFIDDCGMVLVVWWQVILFCLIIVEAKKTSLFSWFIKNFFITSLIIARLKYYKFLQME